MSAPTVVLAVGADALVAAHLLARKGDEVVVVFEGKPRADVGWVPPQILKELQLTGLEVRHDDPWTADGAGLELSQDMARSVESIRRSSPRDAERWPQFCMRMALLGTFLEDVYLAAPPEPTSLSFGLKLRRLGREGMQDMLRLLPMPVADLLDDWFESDALKGLLGGAAVRNLRQGPRSAGTAFTLLHQHVGNPPGVFRLPRSNLTNLLLSNSSITLRRERVAGIAMRAGRATSVKLESGEEIPAAQIVSGLGARRTLLELVDSGWLDPELARQVRNIRTRPVAARVHLQLDRPAAFSVLALAHSLDYVEKAYDDVKYAGLSKRPFIEAYAEGSEVRAMVQFVPEGFSEPQALGERVVEALREHLNGAAVSEVTVQLPAEAPQHAELALDQVLWMRPVPELARYRTPVEGLWLCGPDMHPGPGILGASAYHCVNEMARA